MVHWKTLKIRGSTHEKLMISCTDLFLKHHPEFKRKPEAVTQDFMIDWVCDYYLEH